MARYLNMLVKIPNLKNQGSIDEYDIVEVHPHERLEDLEESVEERILNFYKICNDI